MATWASVALLDSEPPRRQDAVSTPLVDLQRPVEVSVVVRARASDEAIAKALKTLARQPPRRRRAFDLDEFTHAYGATAEDLDRVRDFAAGQGLRVGEVSAGKRTVAVSGLPADFERVFAVSFRRVQHPRGAYRTHAGPIQIPQSLADVIEDVIGLDERPHLRAHAAATPGLTHVDPREVADYYDFPRDSGGEGQCVALVEFGGGFYPNAKSPSPDDMGVYFAGRGLATPRIDVVGVLGASNAPAKTDVLCATAKFLKLTDSDACAAGNGDDLVAFFNTVEATMDVQLVGTVAPRASLCAYFAPDTPRGHFEVFADILVDAEHQPSVVSCSWGSCENELPRHVMRSIDKVLALAQFRGITVCASSGDWGTGAKLCQEATGHFPACCGHVLACGGTRLDLRSGSEVAWQELLGGQRMSSGYGTSMVFGCPWWQSERGVGKVGGKRLFPDVAARANLVHGYDVVVGGMDIPMGGTSAAAPMWASLVALLNSELDMRCGFLNPMLYDPAFDAATRAVPVKPASPPPAHNWERHTGLGRPVGSAMLAALRSR
jgi:kumamolisin